jgi:hypothetical protein
MAFTWSCLITSGYRASDVPADGHCPLSTGDHLRGVLPGITVVLDVEGGTGCGPLLPGEGYVLPVDLLQQSAGCLHLLNQLLVGVRTIS